MKVAIIIACIAVAASAAILPELEARRKLPALRHEEIHDEFGQYAFRYVTAEGTIVSERGHLVPSLDGTSFVMEVDGETTYIGDDGKTYSIKYSAGHDGARIERDEMPKTVPILI